MRRSVKKNLVPLVPAMVQEATNIHALPTGEVTQHSYKSVLKQDAWKDDLEDALQDISDEMMSPKARAIKEMLHVGPKVNAYNKRNGRN